MHSNKVLWQKESKHKNALYTNICVANGYGKQQLNEIYHEVRAEINAHKEMKLLYFKSNKVAKEKRKLGINSFHSRDWSDAIDWFNESLCFAENGSKHIGIAYADRSACFFNLKSYEKCLIDIDLALSNNYQKPAELEKRKECCLAQIASNRNQNAVCDNLQLQSFLSEHGYFTGASDTVELKMQDDRYSVAAKQDIDVGEIIAVDRAFTKTLYTIYGWKCNVCLKGGSNLVPCKRCTTAMFCRECEKNDLHEYECRMKTSQYSWYNNYLMRELRTFFVALNLFETVDQLMEFVDQSLTDAETPTRNINDERLRYKTFLKMANNNTDLQTADDQFAQIVFCVYKILLDIPKVQNMFASKKHRRFLMHIIGHHAQINIRQSYTAKIPVTNEKGVEENRLLYSQVGLMLGFIDHACASNVWAVDRDGDTIYIALRPIKADERLTVNYYGFHWDITGQIGYKEKNHQCSCEMCLHHEAPKDAIETLSSQREYQIVSSREFDLDEQSMDAKTFYSLKKMCSSILQNFGPKFWCSQLKFVLDTYAKMLTVEFNGTMTAHKTSDTQSNNNNDSA